VSSVCLDFGGQGEVIVCVAAYFAGRPKAAAMRFTNGSANRSFHTTPVGFGGKEGIIFCPLRFDNKRPQSFSLCQDMPSLSSREPALRNYNPHLRHFPGSDARERLSVDACQMAGMRGRMCREDRSSRFRVPSSGRGLSAYLGGLSCEKPSICLLNATLIYITR
jgi:hypothetical protein